MTHECELTGGRVIEYRIVLGELEIVAGTCCISELYGALELERVDAGAEADYIEGVGWT